MKFAVYIIPLSISPKAQYRCLIHHLIYCGNYSARSLRHHMLKFLLLCLRSIYKFQLSFFCFEINLRFYFNTLSKLFDKGRRKGDQCLWPQWVTHANEFTSPQTYNYTSICIIINMNEIEPATKEITRPQSMKIFGYS